MDADTVLRIRPALTDYLKEFDDCFGRVTTRRHLDTYVEGQLSDLRRKSVEPIADVAGTPPRTLQEFLGLFRWDEAAVRDRLQHRVARRHPHPEAVGILDETSFPKKGTRTACVQRQHCGATGKTDNCVVSVHLGYATPDDFHTLLDGELYVPRETWHTDRGRCRAAGILDEVIYRTKYQMALGQVRRALANGVRFAWLTFDEGYGGKPPFLRGLDALGQNYVAELPTTFRVWTRRPVVRYRRHPRERAMGRPPRYPRLKAKSNPTVEVRHVSPSRVARRIGDLGSSPRLRRVPWQRYRVKDGSKGPEVWEASPPEGRAGSADGAARPGGGPAHPIGRGSSSSSRTPRPRRLRRSWAWRSADGGSSGCSRTPRANSGWTTSRSASTARSSGTSSWAPSAICSWRSSGWRKGGKNPDLTVAQVHAATAALVPIRIRGGRCTRKRAEAICRRLLLTQQQNSRRPQPPTANPTPIARKRRVFERRDPLSTKALVA